MENQDPHDLSTLIRRDTVDGWAHYAIVEFQKALDKQKIGITRQLFNSFKKQLQANRGDVMAVMIRFLQYGRFVDMGVGRGLAAYERDSNRANLVGARAYGANVPYVKRRPKKWYSKTRWAQMMRLQELLARDLDEDIRGWISAEFGGETTLNV